MHMNGTRLLESVWKKSNSKFLFYLRYSLLVLSTETRQFPWFCLSYHIRYCHKPWIVCLSHHIWKCWDMPSWSPYQNVKTSEIEVCTWLRDLQKECCCAVANSDECCGQTRLKIRSWQCASAFALQVPKSCTDLHPTILFISIQGTYSKFVRKNQMLALGVWLRSHARALAAGLPRQDHVRMTTVLIICFVSTTTISMKCLVWWIPLNTHVRFEQTQPCRIQPAKVAVGPCDWWEYNCKFLDASSYS